MRGRRSLLLEIVRASDEAGADLTERVRKAGVPQSSLTSWRLRGWILRRRDIDDGRRRRVLLTKCGAGAVQDEIQRRDARDCSTTRSNLSTQCHAD